MIIIVEFLVTVLSITYLNSYTIETKRVLSIVFITLKLISRLHCVEPYIIKRDNNINNGTGRTRKNSHSLENNIISYIKHS